MDNTAIDCGEYIYSEEYRSYLIKYDNDLEGVNTVIEPDCINIINNQFLVAYKRVTNLNNAYIYGYNSLPKCFGLMDTTAIESIGADVVRTLPGLELTGKDVLVGFVDTGIDYTNPLFSGADGRTRIEYIWDQNENVYGFAPSIFGYGAEFSKEDIDRANDSDNPYDIVPVRDDNGHGTFLASVAAGRVEEDEPFSGVASECSIAVVKLKPAKNNLTNYMFIPEDAVCYSEEDIILGVKYLVNKAVELDKPLVICLGVGTSQGDHSGNTNLELYINTLSNLRGVCVVSCAGNELGTGGHFSGNNRINTTDATDEVEISVGENNEGFVMEIWGNAPSLLAVSILSPTGERRGNISPARDGRTRLTFLYEGTEVYVDNFVVDSNTGDPHMVLRFVNPAEGIWTINVEETMGTIGGGFDAWLPIEQFRNSQLEFVRSDPDITVCAPGTGKGVICIGGYNHFNNSLYINSSRGFTRKGHIRPDVVAPAVNVYGAFVPTSGSSTETLYTRKSGTSVASAITAGAVALILEWGLVKGGNPGISTEVVRQMIIRGSEEVAEVTYPSRAWGWGVLNLLEVFNSIREL